MTNPSRRSVARAATWAAPIVMVAAAAPAMAASPVVLGPGVTASPGTEGNRSVGLSIPGSGLTVGQTYTLTITQITNTVGNATIWTLPDVTVFVYSGGPIQAIVLKSNAGNPGITWTATYTVTLGGNPVGSGTFTFVF